MAWVFLAISAHFFWALNNIGDKYAISHHIKNPYVYLVWQTLLGAIIILAIPLSGLSCLSLPAWNLFPWLLLAAATYLFADTFYFRAIQIEEVTRINIWWSLIPLFTLAIAWIFLGEKLNTLQIVAFVLLVIGAILASLHIQRRMVSFSKAFWLMVVGCFFYAVYAVIIRFITQIMSFTEVLIWVYLLMIPLALSFFFSKKFRQSHQRDFSVLNKKIVIIIIFVSLASILGVVFNIWALSLGPAALVFSMEGFQAIFAFIITIGLSLAIPGILKESFKKGDLVFKFTALVLMVVGIVLIFLG